MRPNALLLVAGILLLAVMAAGCSDKATCPRADCTVGIENDRPYDTWGKIDGKDVYNGAAMSQYTWFVMSDRFFAGTEHTYEFWARDFDVYHVKGKFTITNETIGFHGLVVNKRIILGVGIDPHSTAARPDTTASALADTVTTLTLQ